MIGVDIERISICHNHTLHITTQDVHRIEAFDHGILTQDSISIRFVARKHRVDGWLRCGTGKQLAPE
jgi:hypothetical protein